MTRVNNHKRYVDKLLLLILLLLLLLLLLQLLLLQLLFSSLPFLYIIFDQHHVDIIDQADRLHIYPMCDLLFPLAQTPDKSDQRLLVSPTKDTVKVG